MPGPRPPAGTGTLPLRELPALLAPVMIGAVLLIGATADPLPAFGLFNTKRLAELGVLPVLLSLAVLDPGIRGALADLLSRVPRALAWTGLAVTALGFVSAGRFVAVSLYPLADVALLVVLVCATLVTAACRRVAGARFDRCAMALLALLAGAVAVQETLGFAASLAAGIPHSYEYMLINFSHPRFYNQLQTWSLPVLAALPWVFFGRRGAPWLTVALLGFGWCILILSGARGSFLAITAASVACAAIARRTRPKWLAVQGAALAVGVLLYLALLGMQGESGPGGGAGDTLQRSAGRALSGTSGRARLWSLAAEQSMDHPILGIGPSRFACVSPTGLGSHPHNFALQILSEWGWPAALLLAGAVLWLGWRLVARLARPPDAHHRLEYLRQALACAVLAAALHAGLSGVLVMPLSQLAAVLIGGWLLGTLEYVPASTDPSRRPAWTLALAGIAAAVLLAAFGGAQLRENAEALAAPPPDRVASPRFWQVGRQCDTGDR